ncbi:MAG: quinone-dependent dihydroorotate dehydrogenase [Chloroflexi bacterium]|nr:quinone-dependent dihydroorotate dehydrogenase [Chloroflexota bacterium]
MGRRAAAYRAVRPILFGLDPERVHHLALSSLRVSAALAPGRAALAFLFGAPPRAAASDPVDLMGLRFRNRIGLGAGFDKDGVAVDGWAALGLGFVEVGTVTPRPQPGNPRPRLYRLREDGALVNRMGFNNAGADALAARLAAVRPRLPDGFVVGVNIGRNRDTPDADVDADYAAAAAAVAGVADYLAVNVSSPNTPGLRDLQDPDRLVRLLDAVQQAAPGTPVVVKLAPDLERGAFDTIATRLADGSASGMILSNTTTARPPLVSRHRDEAGGLSGAPLLDGTLESVERARELVGSRLVIIASGGAGSAADVVALRQRGADLVQLWTSLIYAGPGLIGETVRA